MWLDVSTRVAKHSHMRESITQSIPIAYLGASNRRPSMSTSTWHSSHSFAAMETLSSVSLDERTCFYRVSASSVDHVYDL